MKKIFGCLIGVLLGGAILAIFGVGAYAVYFAPKYPSFSIVLLMPFLLLLILMLLALISALRENHIIPTNSDKRASAFANLRTFYFNLLLRTIGIVVVVFFLNEFLSLLSSQGFFSSPSFLSFLSQWPSFMGFLTTVLFWAIGAGLMAYILYLMVRIIKDD